MLKSIGDTPVEIGGRPFILRLDHQAILYFEQETKWSFAEAILHLGEVARGRAQPKISLMGMLLAAALIANHRGEIDAGDPDLDTIFAWAIDTAIWVKLFDAVVAASPRAKEGDAPLVKPKAKAAKSRKS